VQDLGIDGRMILKQIINKRDGRAWAALILFQDRAKWRLHVKTILNFTFHKWRKILVLGNISFSRRTLLHGVR
jgi:hypothetical protein